jgi:UMF1 family MFS transporter
MYVKSTAVALQALGIISIGTLADSSYYRKRLLLGFALVGSTSAAVFIVLPGSPHAWLPVVAALITLVGNVAYAASIVCANAFLPGLAREDPRVLIARAEAEAEVARGRASVSLDGNGVGDGGAVPELEPGHDPLLDSDSDSDAESRALLGTSTSTSTSTSPSAKAAYAALLSRTMSRLSSTGVAIGFFSGVAMLALLVIPVSAGKGSTRSLELAVGLSGLWWAVFTLPAAVGLPSGPRAPAPDRWLARAWSRIGRMIRPAEMRRLPNLFTYLLAWVFLSDGKNRRTDPNKSILLSSDGME